MILADDMGYSDIGCFGSEISTPHIDRLARNGVMFTQFYNAARCNPTRASLLTGRYPHQAGVGFSDIGLPAYRGRINRESATMAEALRSSGYRTLMSGKWHLGLERPDWPVDRGFDRFFGLLGGAGSYWEVLKGEQYRLALDDKLWTPPPDNHEFYFTDAITEHAVEFVSEAIAEKKPFFLYLSYTAPHWPLHARPEDIAKYRGRYRDGWEQLRHERYQRQRELGIVDAGWALSPLDQHSPPWESLTDAERDEWDLRMAVYAAMIDRMDQGIGRVMAALENLGCAENTLIVFLSDNGGCEEDPNRTTAGSDPDIPPGPRGGFWGYGPPWANASNTPFRKYKRFTHEGGISTPLIAHWPGGIVNPGRVDRDVGHIIDLMPTFLEVAGATEPQTREKQAVAAGEGLSLVPSFSDQSRALHEYLFWEHTGNRAVRAGRWKLLGGRTGDWELYDLQEDRAERHNLAYVFPERVRDLAVRYQKWAARVGAVSWEEFQFHRAQSTNRQP